MPQNMVHTLLSTVTASWAPTFDLTTTLTLPALVVLPVGTWMPDALRSGNSGVAAVVEPVDICLARVAVLLDE